MEPAKKKKPHPLRLTFVLCILALFCYPILKNPFLTPWIVLLTLVSVTAFFVIRAILKKIYPDQFKKSA